MPYDITSEDLKSLAAAMSQYYDDTRQKAQMDAIDNLARANMGVLTALGDKISSTYAAVKQPSADSFKVTLKPKIEQELKIYFANKFEVAKVMLSGLEGILKKGAKLLPGAPLVEKGLSWAISKADQKAHQASIAEADKVVAGAGEQAGRFFENDKELGDAVTKLMKEYLELGKFVASLPASIESFQEAAIYPTHIFRIQKAAHRMRMDLWSVEAYIRAMKERLDQVDERCRDELKRLRTDMAPILEKMIDAAYDAGGSRGSDDRKNNKYSSMSMTQLDQGKNKIKTEKGGITRLAMYLAHASSQGYFDVGNDHPANLAAAPPGSIPAGPGAKLPSQRPPGKFPPIPFKPS